MQCLLSWFRFKYPYLAISVLVSSAPILYFDNITAQNAYVDVVSKDFKVISKTFFLRNKHYNDFAKTDPSI